MPYLRRIVPRPAYFELPRPLERPLLLGRSPDCDLTLDSSHVSRKHARLGFDGAGYFLEDLKSTSGTVHNGMRVERATLRDGDTFMIGPFAYRFFEGDAEIVLTDVDPATARSPARPERETQHPLIRGKLAETPFDELLRLLARNHTDGILYVNSAGFVLRLCFHDGRLHGFSRKTKKIDWEKGTFALRARRCTAHHPRLVTVEAVIDWARRESARSLKPRSARA
jgi:pSer/pThr/pTyr-binding forkhead associated (FHA) protein